MTSGGPEALALGVKSTSTMMTEQEERPGPVAVRMGRSVPKFSAATRAAMLSDTTMVEEQLSKRAWMNGLPDTSGWPRAR